MLSAVEGTPDAPPSGGAFLAIEALVYHVAEHAARICDAFHYPMLISKNGAARRFEVMHLLRRLECHRELLVVAEAFSSTSPQR